MGKFTPGPWQKNRYGDLIGSDGTHVALANAGISLEMSYPHSEAAVANTHLLIAGPDLYAALKAAEELALRLFTSIARGDAEAGARFAANEPAFQAMSAALARVEGRS